MLPAHTSSKLFQNSQFYLTFFISGPPHIGEHFLLRGILSLLPFPLPLISLSLVLPQLVIHRFSSAKLRIDRYLERCVPVPAIPFDEETVGVKGSDG